MRTADEIRVARLREACACEKAKKKKKPVSADQPPEGDGGIEVQSEEIHPFVARALKAILEGEVVLPPPPEPKSPAVSRALGRLRAGLRNVSA